MKIREDNISMNKQALRNALGECRIMLHKAIVASDSQDMYINRVKAVADCLCIIATMLSSPDSWREDPFYFSPICLKCKSEEFGPEDRFCKICGAARPAVKEAGYINED